MILKNKTLFYMALTSVGVTAFVGCDMSDAELAPMHLWTVENVGLYPNQVVLDGSNAYVVASGDNVVNRIDVDTLNIDQAWMDLGQNANPWGMVIHDDDVFVINSMSNTAVKASKSEPKTMSTVLDGAKGLNGPTDLLVLGDKIYISNSEYSATGIGGSILETSASGEVTGDLLENVDLLNPVALYHIDHNFIAVCSGDLYYDPAKFSYTSTSKSGVAFWPTEGTSPSIVKGDPQILLAGEDVGKIAYIGGTKTGESVAEDGYYLVGTSFSSTIHVVSSDLKKVYDLDLDLGSAMLIPQAIGSLPTREQPNGSEDRMFVLANFNEDALYIVDLSTVAAANWMAGDDQGEFKAQILDTRINMKVSPDVNDGPISMAWDANSSYLYVLNSLSETLDIFLIDVDYY